MRSVALASMMRKSHPSELPGHEILVGSDAGDGHTAAGRALLLGAPPPKSQLPKLTVAVRRPDWSTRRWPSARMLRLLAPKSCGSRLGTQPDVLHVRMRLELSVVAVIFSPLARSLLQRARRWEFGRGPRITELVQWSVEGGDILTPDPLPSTCPWMRGRPECRMPGIARCSGAHPTWHSGGRGRACRGRIEWLAG